MSLRLPTFAALGVIAAFQGTAVAQRITVQQPAIGTFGVGTVVSVPDSGRGFLGSVSRAGGGGKTYGPFPSGTSTGWFRQHAGMSMHATIHDLREMDERLLREGLSSARIPTGRKLSANAEHAYRTLISRYESRRGQSSAVRSGRSSQSGSTGNDTAAMIYRLGLQAEQRGHHALALRHFRIAARSGSEAAKRRLSAPRLASRSR